MPRSRLYSLNHEPSVDGRKNPSFLTPESQARLQKIVLSLPERDREVVCRRVGFYAAQETLEEVGASFGVTKEAVRQRQKRILARLRELLADEFPELAQQ